MKPKEQKYREAVERNLRYINQPDYRHAPVETVRMMLGIRKGDTQWDHIIAPQLGDQQ